MGGGICEYESEDGGGYDDGELGSAEEEEEEAAEEEEEEEEEAMAVAPGKKRWLWQWQKAEAAATEAGRKRPRAENELLAEESSGSTRGSGEVHASAQSGAGPSSAQASGEEHASAQGCGKKKTRRSQKQKNPGVRQHEARGRGGDDG